MRNFYEPKGNHGYGLAVAAGPGYVTVGIRERTGQGEIMSIEHKEDAEQVLNTLRIAFKEAGLA